MGRQPPKVGRSLKISAAEKADALLTSAEVVALADAAPMAEAVGLLRRAAGIALNVERNWLLSKSLRDRADALTRGLEALDRLTGLATLRAKWDAVSAPLRAHTGRLAEKLGGATFTYAKDAGPLALVTWAGGTLRIAWHWLNEARKAGLLVKVKGAGWRIAEL